LRCPVSGGDDQAWPLRGRVWLVGWLWHGWVTAGFMIAVSAQKCLKIGLFRSQTLILTTVLR
jgi:hypothetical protein